MKKNLFKVALLLVGLFPIISFATDTFYNPQVPSTFSYVPRIYLESMMGEELLGQGDIIVPVILSNNRSFFLYGQGRVSTPDGSNAVEPFDHAPWMGSFGFGSRGIYGNNTALLGAYVLGDYSKTSGGVNYWDISPGVEALGKVWDFRANGYFPVGKKSWSKEGWADGFGNYDYVKYTGHMEYDRWARYDHFQEVAPGADVEIGRKLFKQKNTLVKAYLGSYYFDMRDNKDILGASARITFQPSQFITFSVNDTYDRQYHNTFMVGMKVRLNDVIGGLIGGHPKYEVTEDRDLSVRLLDPVERNLGSLASATSIPVSKGKMKPGKYGLEHDNIWFFKKGSSTKPQDGTYEHPFVGGFDVFNYVKVLYSDIGAVIDKYPLLYFAPGTYSLGSFPNERFSLPYGWGMYGRTGDYTQPAQGNGRARFNGGLDLFQGNNVLDSIRLLNNNSIQSTGIEIQGSNVYMNNIQVGSNTTNSESYQTGIYINGAGNVTLNESQVYSYASIFGAPWVPTRWGIKIYHGNLTLGDNNTISAKMIFHITVPPGTYTAYGISVDAGRLQINGTHNYIEGHTIAGGDTVRAYGIYAEDISQVDINGSDNMIFAYAGGGTTTDGVGIGLDRSTLNINGRNNVIHAIIYTGSGVTTGANVYGIRLTNNSLINFNARDTDIIVDLPFATQNAWGIKADSGSDIEIKGRRLNSSSLSNLLYYVTFYNTKPGSGGNKVDWSGVGSISW